MTISVTDKSSALAFLDRLAANPLDPALCREFGVEVVPALEIETAIHCCPWCLYTEPVDVFSPSCPECNNQGPFKSRREARP